MSDLQEVVRTFVLFSVFLIVIPVGVFAVDIIRNYYKKEDSQNDLARRSHHNPRG